MPELIIIRGIPGTGKTTLALEYATKGYIHCENDLFFSGRSDKKAIHQFDKELWQQAKNACLQRALNATKAGYNVVVANTFTQHWQYASYVNMAKHYQYTVRIISLTEEHGSIHNVPESEMERIRSLWED